MLRIVCAVVAGSLGASSAMGAVTPVGPFTGGASEGFESFSPGPVGAYLSSTGGPAPVFGGLGTLTGTTTATINPLYIWNSTGGLSLGDYGVAVPYDGIQGLVLNPYGTFDGRIDFGVTVMSFGGYWAHAKAGATVGPVSLTFYDAGGGVIGTDSFNYNGASLHGVLEWHGWTSTTPIAAVRWTGFWATVDGLQIDAVAPAPGACALFVGAGVLGLRRRR